MYIAGYTSYVHRQLDNDKRNELLEIQPPKEKKLLR